MKKLITGIAALLIVAAALPVSANGTSVKNGTPVLDGKLDDIYKESASVELENFGFYVDGSTGIDKESTKGTTAYFLWDEDYLYLCVAVVDDTATKTEEKDVDYTKWSTCDNLELYFWGADGNEDNRGNIHIGCLGLGLRLEKAYENAKIQVVGTATDNGYITELAIPVTNFNLKPDAGFKFALQYNNYVPADKATVACGYQQVDGATDLTLSADKVAEPEPEPANAAQTLDIGIAASALTLAASGAAFVSLKKRK